MRNFLKMITLFSQNTDFIISKNNIILSSNNDFVFQNNDLVIIPRYKIIILGKFLTHSYSFKFHVRDNYL